MKENSLTKYCLNSLQYKGRLHTGQNFEIARSNHVVTFTYSSKRKRLFNGRQWDDRQRYMAFYIRYRVTVVPRSMPLNNRSLRTGSANAHNSGREGDY